jgi:ferritin-like metal-binding protein YciE
MADQELLVAWLKDAYAMEQALIRTLEHRVKDAKDYPHVQARDQQHLEETRRHADLVKQCVERLGSDTSALKTGMANIMGTMTALSTGAAKDELVKNCLADYAAEPFEVACYTALIAGAELLGDRQTAQTCRQILAEDEAMAAWIAQQLPLIVQEVLQRPAA